MILKIYDMHLIMLQWRHHSSAHALRAIESFGQRKFLRGTQKLNVFPASPKPSVSVKKQFWVLGYEKKEKNQQTCHTE